MAVKVFNFMMFEFLKQKFFILRCFDSFFFSPSESDLFKRGDNSSKKVNVLGMKGEKTTLFFDNGQHFCIVRVSSLLRCMVMQTLSYYTKR